jgi:hypothetical protein
MGRVKVPRCDNCGAPVEFGEGATEARCAYCGELLIRELYAPKAVWAPPVAPPPPPVIVKRKGTVAPFVLAGMATLAIAGASSFASLAPRFTPLPETAPVEERSLAVAASNPVQHIPTVSRVFESRNGPATARPRPSDTTTPRNPLRARPTTAPTALPVTTPGVVSTTPPPLPRFDGQAAAAGLDAAKAKAEASCRGTTGVRLFVQMGFDADGVNRGAALSDPKLKGTPEAKCTLRIFRAVRIPAFDLKTRSSGLGRLVRL